MTNFTRKKYCNSCEQVQVFVSELHVSKGGFHGERIYCENCGRREIVISPGYSDEIDYRLYLSLIDVFVALLQSPDLANKKEQIDGEGKEGE